MSMLVYQDSLFSRVDQAEVVRQGAAMKATGVRELYLLVGKYHVGGGGRGGMAYRALLY